MYKRQQAERRGLNLADQGVDCPDVAGQQAERNAEPFVAEQAHRLLGGDQPRGD